MCSQSCQHSMLAGDIVGRGGVGREGWGGCAMSYRTAVNAVFIELCEIIIGFAVWDGTAVCDSLVSVQ